MKKILFLILSITLLKNITMEHNLLTISSNNNESYVIGIPVTDPINNVCTHISSVLQKPDEQKENHYIGLLNLTLSDEMLPTVQTTLAQHAKQLKPLTIDMAYRVIRENSKLYWYPNTKNPENSIVKSIALRLLCQLQKLPLSASDRSQRIEPCIVFNNVTGESHTVLATSTIDESLTKFSADQFVLVKIDKVTNQEIAFQAFPFQIGILLRIVGQTVSKTLNFLKDFLDTTNG